jgi:uncharacterized protein YfaS (alpha-2-macroglobulin family)
MYLQNQMNKLIFPLFFSLFGFVNIVAQQADPFYPADWNRVDAYAKKDLMRSAVAKADSIYMEAKKAGNTPEMVKALINMMNYDYQVSDSANEKWIYRIQAEIKTAHCPEKQLLSSLLAEMYWSYYGKNRYRFYNRTQTVNFNNNDIGTWDVTKIVDEALRNYETSLENEDSLEKIGMDKMDVILVKGNTRNLRPTLYDFLAHRALSFFQSSEPEITRPAVQFNLNDSSYLTNYNDFIKIKFKTDDTLSTGFYALKVLQHLLAFHASSNSGKDIAPLIEVDMERLNFIHTAAANISNKDSLYIHALRMLRDKFISDPASTDVDYQLAMFYYVNSSYNAALPDLARWNKKKSLEICEAASRRFPESFGASECKQLEYSIKEKYTSFSLPQVNIPDKPFAALLQFQNMDKAYIRIIKVNPEKFENENWAEYGGELPKEWLAISPVKEWSVDLPKESDYQYHSAEIKIPALPSGFYVVLVSPNNKFTCDKNLVAYRHCWVSNISYTVRTHPDGSREYTVLDRTNGKPMKNVRAQVLYNGEYDYTGSYYKLVKGPVFNTDADGHFIVHPRKEHYDEFKLDLSTGKNRFIDFEASSLYDNRYWNNKEIRSVTYFFTDRAIYRPGQTVYFKGILLKTDGDKSWIDSNKSTEVTLYDVNYQKVASLDLVSDAYGSVSGTFVLPLGLLNGSMRLYDGGGTKYIQVEDYKRPKFYVNVDTVKGNFRLGETINITGVAKGYNGAAIDGANVKYRIVRSENIPWWYTYYWGRYTPTGSAPTEITNGNIASNDTGGFAFNFKALPDANESKLFDPTFIFTVYVDVTDANGETHSTRAEVEAGYTAITLDVQIPQMVNKTGIDTFYVETDNMQKSKVAVTGNIVIYKLKEPMAVYRARLWSAPDTFVYNKQQWDTVFPNDPYSDEDKITSYPKGEKVFEQNFNTGEKKYTIIPSLSGWQQGSYVMEAHTKDIFGQDVKDLKYFVVYSPEEKNIPTNTADYYSVIKNYCQPGEKAKFSIGSAYDNVTILYEVEKKNKIVHREWLTLNHEQRIIEIPITDSDRGGFGVHFVFVKNNRIYIHDDNVSVDWSNKNLDLKFESFRDKLLPGQKEQWKIKVRDNKGQKANAQMMATLYDASLDEFVANAWSLDIYPFYGVSLTWTDPGIFASFDAFSCSKDWYTYTGTVSQVYDKLISAGYYYTQYAYESADYKYRGMYTISSSTGATVTKGLGDALEKKDENREAGKEEDKTATTEDAPTATPEAQTAQETTVVNGKLAEHHEAYKGGAGGDMGGENDERANLSNVTARSNFNETAFFYPTLNTDDSGNIIIKFTVPEATTRWKMMGMAHSRDLKVGYIQNQLVTQKDLMVTPNAPRFLRENDTIIFTSKITDLADKDLSGAVQLFLYDALDMKDITSSFAVQQAQQNFSVKKGLSAVVTWQLIIPAGIDAVTYKVVAQAGNYSDGEQNTLPVLPNSMLVTESIPLSVGGKQKRTFTFDKLLSQNNHSTTLRNQKVTLEFTANPAWYAIQALPYIMEYPYECAEQTFDRFYANSIATNIANSSPRIKAVFESWKSRSPEAFLSNLEKNQDLKTLMLEETPWVLEAKDESERKKRVGLLFDLNRMSNELSSTLNKLEKKQSSDGGWSWFPGMQEDRYMTQYIITGFGHLDHLGIKNVRSDYRTWNMVNRGIQFIDARMNEDYNWLLKYYPKNMDDNHLDYEVIQYLYTRSYFKDILVNTSYQKAFDYYKGQAQKYWEKENNNYMQGMIALALNRFGVGKTALDIMAALKENATNRADFGMYWASDEDGYSWYDSKIEEHALMIEAFDEVSHDEKSVDALKVWLLRSKQTQDWGTTKATAEACYSLLLKGTDIVSREPRIEINVGDKKIELAPSGDSVVHGEAGIGYFNTSWTGSDIKPEMGNITVTKSDSGLSWGAVYWQYFEQLDKITPHKTPLNIIKKLFVERITSSGIVMEPFTASTELHPGDKIKVRIELRVDRDMDYVQMKDMRASCMEPVDVISEYKYQEGLGYYQSTRDAATNFFFDHVRKGAYVFEYAMFVTNKGKFSNGITTIQCMYAPEFNSHSEGVRVKVK